MAATVGLGLGALALGLVGVGGGGFITAVGVFRLAERFGLVKSPGGDSSTVIRQKNNNPRMLPFVFTILIVGGVLAMYSGGSAAYLLGKAICCGTKVPSVATHLKVLVGGVGLIAFGLYKLFTLPDGPTLAAAAGGQT